MGEAAGTSAEWCVAVDRTSGVFQIPGRLQVVAPKKSEQVSRRCWAPLRRVHGRALVQVAKQIGAGQRPAAWRHQQKTVKADATLGPIAGLG